MSDLKLAFRQLAKSPGFTAIALLTLALGTGVNTAMVSFVDFVLLNPPSLPHGAALHQIRAFTPQGPRDIFSETEGRELRAGTRSFVSLTNVATTNHAFAEAGQPPEQISGTRVSAEFFDTFGVTPQLGRAFASGEFQSGGNQAIILSHAFWQARFGGRRDIIGQSLRVDTVPVTVVGIMPASFDNRFIWGTTAFWQPIAYPDAQLAQRGERGFLVVGRLKPGATAAQADAELAAVAALQRKDFPHEYTRLSYAAIPVHKARIDDYGRQMLLMLLVLSGFVLLIACTNLANLQLARASTTMREFAIRAALGASRGALIRQQLTQSLLLALGGGALGVVLALWITDWLSKAVVIDGVPGFLDLAVNGTVLAAAIVVATLTGLIFGLVPAWLSSRPDVISALKSQSRGATAGRGHHRLRQTLIVAEVCLALVLLGGAGVMQRGFGRIIHRDVGWDKDRLLIGEMSLPESRFANAESRFAFYNRVETRLAALPGVEQVALASHTPVWNFGTYHEILTGAQAGADKATLPRARHVMITADFFKVIGVSLLEGQPFARGLKPGDPNAIIINQPLAEKLWPGQSALGRQIGSFMNGEPVWCEVVGVVPSLDSAATMFNAVTPYQVFRPLEQEPVSLVRFTLRGAQPGALASTARRALAEVDPDLPVTEIMTVADAYGTWDRDVRVIVKMLAGFAALGLVLSAIGIYGVISNLVAQRTGEFGIRLALGARPKDVLGLVMGHGLKFTAIGLGLGLAGAYGVARLLHGIFPRLANPDALTLGGVAALLFAVAAAACWFPARRAARVDPMTALRAE